jgi:hypothetical protein
MGYLYVYFVSLLSKRTNKQTINMAHAHDSDDSDSSVPSESDSESESESESKTKTKPESKTESKTETPKIMELPDGKYAIAYYALDYSYESGFGIPRGVEKASTCIYYSGDSTNKEFISDYLRLLVLFYEQNGFSDAYRRSYADLIEKYGETIVTNSQFCRRGPTIRTTHGVISISYLSKNVDNQHRRMMRELGL